MSNAILALRLFRLVPDYLDYLLTNACFPISTLSRGSLDFELKIEY